MSRTSNVPLPGLVVGAGVEDESRARYWVAEAHRDVGRLWGLSCSYVDDASTNSIQSLLLDREIERSNFCSRRDFNCGRNRYIGSAGIISNGEAWIDDFIACPDKWVEFERRAPGARIE